MQVDIMKLNRFYKCDSSVKPAPETSNKPNENLKGKATFQSLSSNKSTNDAEFIVDADCSDKIDANCGYWSMNKGCANPNNFKYMLMYCRKTCGLCK